MNIKTNILAEEISKFNEDDTRYLISALNDHLDDILADHTEPVTSYGELIDIHEFEDAVFNGLFNCHDGCGYYATSTSVSELPYIFYDLKSDDKRRKYNFTHIMWYNK